MLCKQLDSPIVDRVCNKYTYNHNENGILNNLLHIISNLFKEKAICYRYNNKMGAKTKGSPMNIMTVKTLGII